MSDTPTNGNDQNGHSKSNGNVGLIPARPRSSNSKSNESHLDYRGLFNALRRRWFLAVILGLLFGGGAAAAAWHFIPAPYETSSEVRIWSVERNQLFRTAEQQASFSTYKQTQMRHVKSPLVVNAALRDPKVQKTRIVRQQQHPREYLEEAVQVSNSGTEFFEISLSGEHPQDLAAIVNGITNAYLEEVVNGEQRAREDRLSFLEGKLSNANEDLRIKRKGLQDVVKSIEPTTSESAQAQVEFLLELQLQLRKELAQVYLEWFHAKSRLQTLPNEQGEEVSLEIPETILNGYIIQNEEYSAVDAEVWRLERALARKQNLSDNSPSLVKAREDLADARRRQAELYEKLRPEIINQLKSQVQGVEVSDRSELERQVQELDAKKQNLEAELDGIKIKQKETGFWAIELEERDKDIEQAETIAATISMEVERRRIELDSPLRIERYREAEVPLKRNEKKKYAGTALAGFGIFGLFVAGIVWLEFRARRITSLGDLSNCFPLRVMGIVPHMPRSASRSNKSRQAYWNSVLTESIDSTRTMLLRDARLESVQVVMIASAVGSEGKTSLACHLATSLARAGRSVVLVDCDLRRPSIHKVFDEPMSRGVCEFVQGEVDLDEIVRETSTPELSLILAGKVNQPVLQALAQDGVGPLFDQLREEFDFVIVDSAPVLPVTDSLLVAQHADAVVMSIRRDVSRAAKVAAACQRLTMLGIPLLGTVAIGLEDESYGYGYAYGYRDRSFGRYYSQPIER